MSRQFAVTDLAQAYPTTFVIDRAGRIVFRDMGSDKPTDLQAAVEKALSMD